MQTKQPMRFKLPQNPEREIRKVIIEVLLRNKYFVWTNNVGSLKKRYTDRLGATREYYVQFGKAGMSDIIGVQPVTGKFIAIEVKTPQSKRNVTLPQKLFIEDVIRHGGIAFVAWSVDMVCDKLGIKGLQ